ncbi:MAG: hypothetical protein DI570_18155 [Phenylobacterium zucineum]|jgi:hypothetical protein|nr:MAG: hypothetical protein DI570_18155 [Phenylobacterium zucineum]
MTAHGRGVTYEFMSPPWLAALHGIISERVSQVARREPGMSFSVCEVARDPPAHLSPDGASLSWCCRVTQGLVTFSLEPAEDVDLRVEGDYAALASLAPIVVDDDPEAATRLREASDALVAAGRVRVSGAAVRPASIGSFHDAIARLTTV